MTPPPVLIVGSGLAGWTVARELRKLDQETPLTLVTADGGDFYSKPMLSNALAQGRTAATLITTPAEKMAATLNVTLRPRSRLRAIDRQRREVAVDGETIGYSRLVLALGADPIRLPLAGDAAADVLSVNDVDDYAIFRRRLVEARSVAIIGAGLIGCEFANDLASQGLRVHVIDPAASPIAALLPKAAGDHLLAPLSALGVVWHLGGATASVDRGPHGFRLSLTDGSTIDADLVLSAVGLRPRITLAKDAGLAVDRGIVVDAFLRSSDPSIHALGDCAQYPVGALPFVMPIMAAARALAPTLAGRETAALFPPMPVIIKTPAHPVVVLPAPRGSEGSWRIAGDDPAGGVKMLFQDAASRLLGFALTGVFVGERTALVTRIGQPITSWIA